MTEPTSSSDLPSTLPEDRRGYTEGKVCTFGSLSGNVLLEFQSVLRTRPDTLGTQGSEPSHVPLALPYVLDASQSISTGLQQTFNQRVTRVLNPVMHFVFCFLIINTQQGVSAMSQRPFKTQLLWTRVHAGWPPGRHFTPTLRPEHRTAPRPHTKAGTTSPVPPKEGKRNPITNHPKCS